MKRIILVLCCLFAIMGTPMSVHAQEDLQKVGNGYTPEGVYYEVFITEETENNDISLCGTSVSVTREVRYSGIITPLTEISWREKINGVYYSGTLRLKRFSCTSTETIATYTGVLYQE